MEGCRILGIHVLTLVDLVMEKEKEKTTKRDVTVTEKGQASWLVITSWRSAFCPAQCSLHLQHMQLTTIWYYDMVRPVGYLSLAIFSTCLVTTHAISDHLDFGWEISLIRYVSWKDDMFLPGLISLCSGNDDSGLCLSKGIIIHFVLYIIRCPLNHDFQVSRLKSCKLRNVHTCWPIFHIPISYRYLIQAAPSMYSYSLNHKLFCSIQS